MNKSLTRLVSLTTDFEKDLESFPIPFDEYPRPQMKRSSYLCLNGKWHLQIEGKSPYSGEITVPFAPESRLSGVMREIGKDDLLIYDRSFFLDESFLSGHCLLHVDACDQFAEIYVNGTFAGKNEGGYLPFTFDITDLCVPGENSVRIEVRDPLDKDLPYGKQSNNRGGMWYTKISGIWKTVWIESVPENYIKVLKITPDLSGINIQVTGGCDEKLLIFEGREYPFNGFSFRLEVENPILWTPDNPKLYEFTLISGEDRVESYFGLRTVGITKSGDTPFVSLNGKPIFAHGLLDQGYFSDGIFLPASPRGYKEDILKMKSCGFNMLRKHIKLEADLFYYYCDKYGMLVFQDMINSGKYNFIIDTALPTVFLRRGISHRASKRRKDHFFKTCDGIIDTLYNHPSVVYYTIFNEGWGQFEADACYRRFKSLDPTRIWDTASGWFKSKESDVESEHVYFKPVNLKKSPCRPLILSEFGGFSCKIKDHSFNLDKTYGYRYFENCTDFEKALLSLYENEILHAIDQGLCAAVLTQISDVEDETNGILTYDRRVMKVSSEKMKVMSEKLYKRFSQLY